MLKSLWDTIDLVKHSFNDWNSTLWCDINVDQMELDCKKFVKVEKAKHIFGKQSVAMKIALQKKSF